MAFNVNEIKGALTSKNGVLRPAHFLVMINPPNSVINAPLKEIIPFFCEGTALPGVEYQTMDTKPYGVGLSERRPIHTVYRELPMTFLVDGKGEIIKFFHKWKSTIQNTNDKQKKAGQSFQGMGTYDFNYPVNYQTTIDIYQYHPSGEKVLTYTLFDAYPIACEDMPVHWSHGDELLRFQVIMAYRNWTSDAIEPTEASVDESIRAKSTRVDERVSTAGAKALLSTGNAIRDTVRNQFVNSAGIKQVTALF